MSKNSIPDGWLIAAFSDVIKKMSNGVGGKQSKDGVGLPVSRIETIADESFNFNRIGFIADYDSEKVGKYKLNEGDILFSHINSPVHLGKTAIFKSGKDLYHGINLLRIEVEDGIVPELFNQFCRYTRGTGEFSLRAQHAVNQSSINQKKLGAFEFPLPPIAEQREIARRLDELLAQVDTLKTRLDAIPSILKRFRQSTLAAATSGKLTEQWRSVPKFGTEIKIGDVASSIKYGTSKKCSTDSGETPVLRIPNIGNGNIDLSNLKFADFDEKERDKLELVQGDILVIRSNGSVDLVGKAALIDEASKHCLYAGYLIRIRINASKVLPKYLLLCLQCPQMRKVIEIQARSTSGVNNINSKELAALSFIAPAIEEQTEIVRRVEELFAFADQVEQRVNDAQARVNHLTQSILAKAFRGELTESWRANHPDLITGKNSAEALLKRIKTERANLTPKKKTRRKK